MQKKTIVNWLGVIILGAFGSALWEFIKPAFVWLWTALVSASTLGVASYRDQIYANAGATFGEPLGIGAAITALAALMMLCTGITINFMVRTPGTLSAQAPRFFTQLFLLSMGMGLLIGAIQRSYSLSLAHHYRHLAILAAPSLTDIEIRQYQATFSDVKTREQYVAVIASLVKRIEATGKKAPSRDFL